jgi:hypothetical protein
VRILIIGLLLFTSCKPYNLDFGERHLVKNYEVKRRKKVAKYLKYQQKPKKKG